MDQEVIAVSLPIPRSRADEAEEPPPELDVGAVYRAHGPAVLRWAKRLGGPGIDAEDVAQDVFLIAKRRLRSFEGEAKITTWLFRTTQKVAQAARRKQRLRRWFSSAPQAEWASMGSPAPGPGESLQRDRDIAEVYRVLDRLPERERRVMILFEIEGLSTEEIGALTGTKVGSVRVRLFRARERFANEHRRLFAARESKVTT